jgi:two-component system response regulator HydG
MKMGQYRHTALIVSAEADTVKALKKMLDSDCYSCGVACAADALRLLHRLCFEVVITDLRLPDASGLALCEQIKQTYPATAVLLYAGTEAEETSAEAARKGAQACLPASLEPQQLQAILRQVWSLPDERLSNDTSSHDRAQFYEETPSLSFARG